MVIEDSTENMETVLPLPEEYQKYYSDAEYITVSKVVRTIEESPRGESYTTYDEYLIADIDLIEGKDFSENYTLAMKGGAFEPANIIRAPFVEIFGFDYKGKNGWNIYEELLQKNQLEVNMQEGVLIEDTYKITGQKLIQVQEDDSIWNNLLDGVVYDEIIEKKVYYQIHESEDGFKCPDCFSAVIRYKDGGWTITKSMFLQVLVIK